MSQKSEKYMRLQESINLVSSYAGREGISGPGKVLDNLIKGLRKINHPYVVNRGLDTTPFLWVHSDFSPLMELPTEGVFSVLGPNLAVLPRDLPGRRRFAHSVYVHPSEWAAQVWVEEGFDRCPLRVWPVGIDTEQFTARTSPARGAPILLYHKRRSASDLAFVQNILNERGIGFETLAYGHYSQDEYIDKLRSHAFVLWLGRHESQGIALQEALAMGVPVLVADALSVFDEQPAAKGLFPERLRSFRTTCAPYFDSRCGLVVDDLNMLGEALVKMRSMLGTFCPRDYVLQNLTLEKQAMRFVDLFSELAREHCTRSRRAPALVDWPYKPRLSTRIRAQVSLRSNNCRMKLMGIL